jgi:hypothetical protein
MSITKKVLLSLGAIIVSGSSVLAINSIASAEPSSFYKSCKDISIQGATLQASCRKPDGSYLRSSLTLQGITNVDGNLEYLPGRESTFHRSCTNININRSLLSGNCRTRNGELRRSTLRLNDIHNRNGFLSNS